MNIYQYVGAKITEQRKQLQMSISDLAGSLNVSPSTLSRWESGVQSIRLHDLERVANYFSVDVADFLPVSEETRAANIGVYGWICPRCGVTHSPFSYNCRCSIITTATTDIVFAEPQP